jgi:hypothetical protein
MLSKWDAITWTLVLAIVPYGWTVVGALLMCWMVVQFSKSEGLPPCLQPDVYPKDLWPYELPGTVIYGDISPRHPDKDVMGNRDVWKDFYDNDKF